VSDSNLELPPLDGDVEALLRIERERPSVSADQAERMWSAISFELAAVTAPGAASASPVGRGTSTAQSSLVSGIGKLALLKAIPLVAVSLAVGSVGGFVAGHRVAEPRAGHVPLPNPREPALRMGPAPVPELAPLPAPLSSPVEPPSSATPVPDTLPPAWLSPHVRHRSTTRSGDDLAEEEALLHQSESALRAGNWSIALAEIDAYARRYPYGELAEEAAYLGVRANERGGDTAGARTRLLEFRKRFPSSPLGKATGE
jgi:hypothetical protein